MKQLWGAYISGTLVVLAFGLVYWYPDAVERLGGLIVGQTGESYGVFVLLLVVATVVAPVSALPLIPLVSPIFGPFVTGILSIIGWTLGAAGAFLVSRYIGRPLLTRVVSLEKVDAVLERIPPDARFLSMVVLRMALPVDVVSYALGLVRGVSFISYITATVIGVSYFSFAFAYLGNAVFERDMRGVLILGAGSLVLFVLCWGILLRSLRKRP